MRRIRRLKDKRGQMRVIETLLAAFIIIAALSFVGIFAVSPTGSGYDVTDLEKMGYGALHELDQQGILAPLVYNQEWADLRTVLKITIPVDVYFNLTIYNLSGSKLNGETQILYGDSTTFSDAKNVASVSYSLLGLPQITTFNQQVEVEADYDPRILVLQITRG
jgi:hypothetical protein